MSIVFFGSPLFAIPSLKSLLDEGEDISAVVTQIDKRKGRGGKIQPPPIKEFALMMGLRVLQPESMKDEGFINELRDMKPEFIVVVAYGKILTQAVLDVPSVAPVNLHASLLPEYRGASPIAWAIINGEKETGLTTMFITKKLDEGDIILQENHPIYDGDTTETLSGRLAEAGGPLLVKTLKGLRDGTLKAIPQGEGATYYPMLHKDDGRVDWTKLAGEVYNFVRGMYPWPCAFCYIDSERVKILKVRVVEGIGRPGEILNVSKDAMLIGAGSGIVSIEAIQPEGGRPMPIKAFLQGRKIRKGTALK